MHADQVWIRSMPTPTARRVFCRLRKQGTRPRPSSPFLGYAAPPHRAPPRPAPCGPAHTVTCVTDPGRESWRTARGGAGGAGEGGGSESAGPPTPPLLIGHRPASITPRVALGLAQSALGGPEEGGGGTPRVSRGGASSPPASLLNVHPPFPTPIGSPARGVRDGVLRRLIGPGAPPAAGQAPPSLAGRHVRQGAPGPRASSARSRPRRRRRLLPRGSPRPLPRPPARPAAPSRSGWAGTARGLSLKPASHRRAARHSRLERAGRAVLPPPPPAALARPWRPALPPWLADRAPPGAPSCRTSPAAAAPGPPRHGLDHPEPLRAAACRPARAPSRPVSPPSPLPRRSPDGRSTPGGFSSAGQRCSPSGIGCPAPHRGTRRPTLAPRDRAILPPARSPSRELDSAPTASRRVSTARGFGWGGLEEKKKKKKCGCQGHFWEGAGIGWWLRFPVQRGLEKATPCFSRSLSPRP